MRLTRQWEDRAAASNVSSEYCITASHVLDGVMTPHSANRRIFVDRVVVDFVSILPQAKINALFPL